MQWLELSVDAPADGTEALCARLENLGVTGLVIEDEADFEKFLQENQRYWDYVDDELRAAMAGKSRVTFYLEDSPEGHARLEALRAALDAPVAVATIREEDWANNWKKYYKPIPVGRRLLVVPQWETVDPGDRIPLRLDPGLIFGTGAHPTTRLCLEALEDLVRPGCRVLDLGCGSGILGIAALLLGAGHVLGCDIDPKAPDIVRENAALNDLDESRFQPVGGDVLSDGPLRRTLGERRYDLILANIVADVIIGLADFTCPWLEEGGTMVCSGIIEGRQDEVEQALLAGGFAVVRHECMEDWHSFLCRKK